VRVPWISSRAKLCFLPEEMCVQGHSHRAPGDEDLLNLAVVYALRHRSRV